MAKRSGKFATPPVWHAQRFNDDRQKAIVLFRDERIKEPLEKYLEILDIYRGVFEEFLEATVDLTHIYRHALEIVTNEQFFEALRYLPGPPISRDDMMVVADAPSIAPRRIKENPEIAQKLVQTVMDGLDRQRFPWVSDGREATEHERQTAILASAALIASRRVETERRFEAKSAQEQRVREVLLRHGFREVSTRNARTLSDAPRAGEFCMESELGNRKADMIVGLWDARICPIECKVSNSATNSIKRLNNDAAIKAEVWKKDFGENHIVPAAVLSGVYSLRNLEDAQRRGLTVFWAHSLHELTAWIDKTKDYSSH